MEEIVRVEETLSEAATRLSYGAHLLEDLETIIAYYNAAKISIKKVPDDTPAGVQPINPYEHFVTLEISTVRFDVSYGLKIGDIVRSFRASLDYAVTAIYRERGLRDNRVDFPIKGTVEEIQGKRNPIKERELAWLAHVIENEIRPGANGNRLLWEMNQMDRANKHRVITTTEEIVVIPMVDYTGPGLVFRDNITGIEPGMKSTFRFSVPHPGYSFKGRAQLKIYFGRKEDYIDDSDNPWERLHILRRLKQYQKVTAEAIGKINEAYVKNKK